jgi:hypothetical protein
MSESSISGIFGRHNVPSLQAVRRRVSGGSASLRLCAESHGSDGFANERRQDILDHRSTVVGPNTPENMIGDYNEGRAILIP